MNNALESIWKWFWPILKFYTNIYLGGESKSTKYISHDLQSADSDSEPEFVKSKVVTLLQEETKLATSWNNGKNVNGS
jgi:hypothetical protein